MYIYPYLSSQIYQVSCYLKSLFTPELMEEEHRIWTKAMEDKVPTFYEGRTRDGKTKQTWTVLPFRTLWWDAGGHMFGMLDVLHKFRGQVPGRVMFRWFVERCFFCEALQSSLAEFVHCRSTPETSDHRMSSAVQAPSSTWCFKYMGSTCSNIRTVQIKL